MKNVTKNGSGFAWTMFFWIPFTIFGLLAATTAIVSSWQKTTDSYIQPCYSVLAPGTSIKGVTKMEVPLVYAKKIDPNYITNARCNKLSCIYGLVDDKSVQQRQNTINSSVVAGHIMPLMKDSKTPIGMELYPLTNGTDQLTYVCIINECTMTTYIDSNQAKVIKLTINNLKSER